jgi:hypothetical protein
VDKDPHLHRLLVLERGLSRGDGTCIFTWFRAPADETAFGVWTANRAIFFSSRTTKMFALQESHGLFQGDMTVKPT